MFTGLIGYEQLSRFALVLLLFALQPPADRQQQAIIYAIRDIVWRAVPSVSGVGRRNYALLALRGPRANFGRSASYLPDGLTETLMLQRWVRSHSIPVV